MARNTHNNDEQPKSTFIDINRAYTIPGLCKALGVEERTISKARAQGLKAKYFGERRIVIRGKDIDHWLEHHALDAPAPQVKTEPPPPKSKGRR